ncbi:T9SS type B sorting domain-containing protein [uncultured Winogradskyella sp.]|uniref:T9SS type B sorting domain-containing protein n=1 Tax=uncultured Winogradskyella sp. TaxID=395353 RepID=UPI002608495C|nr:T9SS type B sorting domain-containing protein [uncultured Winogradskyella sp.]
MKKILILIVFTILGVSINAQQEASNWYFGDNAGISFNQDGTITALSDGQLSTDEGCTSISDGSGNLLFYTDGITVYDRNNNVMQGGTGLKGNPSSTQSALIVPKPQDSDTYYIFTVDTAFQNNPDEGFHYYEVNMLLNGGLGGVISETQLLQNSTEKISAVLKDCNTQNIWVITLSNPSGTPVAPNSFTYNTFHAYEVTAAGVNTTAVTSPTGISIDEQRGYLKFSPNGEKLAMANIDEGLFVYDFDVTTGMVEASPTSPTSLSITTVSNGAIFSYGLEFSPNSELLYVSSYNNFFIQPANNPANNNPVNHSSSLVQFDLTNANIQGSQILIDQRQSYRSALQTGPDGRIFRTTSATYNIGLPFLSVINNPNEIGSACDYQHDAIALSNNSRQGLPPFIASFFVDTIDIINNPNITTTLLPLCEGESYTLVADNIMGATYTWSFDGIVQPTPPIPYEYEVFQNGLYEVLIELNNGDCETFEGEALVQYSPFPEAYTPPKIDVCDDDGNDELYRFDLTQQDTFALGGQDPNDFTVHYYTSEMDAINDENEINGLYENTTNPEEIFVGVKSVTNRNCFKTTDENTGLPISFFIEVFNTPIISDLNNITSCDTEGDTTDGVITTILSNLNNDILGANQLASGYTITYHGNFNDADNGVGNIPNNYQNTPFNDEVFVRMVNNSNASCVTIDSFTITINLTPAVNDIGLFQCDEDGIPDARTVFNILEKEEDITGGNPNFSTSYYLNMTDAMAETDPIDASNYTNISSPQIIIARVTDTSSDCFSFSEVTLEVSATSANDAYLGICDTDDDEDGFIGFDLSMADAQVLDGLPAGLDLTYYETLDDALLEENPLANDYRNTTAFNQTIFVRVENNNDCYGINEVELEVLTLPNVIIEEETLYCLNIFPEKIKINGGVIDDIPNNYYYNWSTGETTIEIEVNEPGVYTVTVANVAGCSKERTVTVLASNTATIDNIEVTDTSENNSITVLVTGEGDYEYALEDPNGIYQDSNVFENVLPGIYSVFVRDKNGCGITEDMVSVVGFPKFFTPNGDNQNDFWQVKGISSQFQPDTVIYIFDKYGKLVSEVNPLGSGWDGNYNGNPLPSSDYWFSVTLQDGRRFSSHFALKR